jgi:hypothetical protein
LVEIDLQSTGVENIDVRTLQISERTFGDPNGLSRGLRHTLGGLPQCESECGDKGRSNGGDGVAVFVKDMSGATDTDRGVISERENEWWRIFFCLLALGCALFLYAE